MQLAHFITKYKRTTNQLSVPLFLFLSSPLVLHSFKSTPQYNCFFHKFKSSFNSMCNVQCASIYNVVSWEIVSFEISIHMWAIQVCKTGRKNTLAEEIAFTLVDDAFRWLGSCKLRVASCELQLGYTICSWQSYLCHLRVTLTRLISSFLFSFSHREWVSIVRHIYSSSLNVSSPSL